MVQKIILSPPFHIAICNRNFSLSLSRNPDSVEIALGGIKPTSVTNTVICVYGVKSYSGLMTWRFGLSLLISVPSTSFSRGVIFGNDVIGSGAGAVQ